MSLSRLGLSPEQQAGLESALDRRRGVIVLTGPGECGRTETAYALLGGLLQRDRLVYTAESDPAARLDGAVQCRVEWTGYRRTSTTLSGVQVAARARLDHCDVLYVDCQYSWGEVFTEGLHFADEGGLLILRSRRRFSADAMEQLQWMNFPTSASGLPVLVVNQRRVPLLPGHWGRPGHTSIYELLERQHPDEVEEDPFTLHARLLGPTLREHGLSKVAAGEIDLRALLAALL